MLRSLPYLAPRRGLNDEGWRYSEAKSRLHASGARHADTDCAPGKFGSYWLVAAKLRASGFPAKPSCGVRIVPKVGVKILSDGSKY